MLNQQISSINNNIAIFGGSFNPPTIAHLKLVDKILSLNMFNSVYVLPSYKHYIKQEYSVDYNKRLEMCNITFKSNNVIVSDLEKTFNDKFLTDGTTYSLIKQLNNYFDKHINIYFVIGLDNAIEIDKWYNSIELRKICKFITVNRLGYTANINDWYNNNGNIYISDFNYNISSSMIRNDIISNKDFLDNKIFEYILKNKLYTKG